MKLSDIERLQEDPRLQPHEQRVVDERAELQGRLERLTAFIDQPATAFAQLPREDCALLIRQRAAMTEYRDVLDLRIARFDGDS